MRLDYPNLETYIAGAHRARAEAVHELIIAPLGRLIARLAAAPAKLRRSRWIAVHHGS
jgi:hypothetical protein